MVAEPEPEPNRNITLWSCETINISLKWTNQQYFYSNYGCLGHSFYLLSSFYKRKGYKSHAIILMMTLKT